MIKRRSDFLVGVLAVACVLAFRLIIAADRDILAVNAPYDEYWFVHSAALWVWGGNYTNLSFAHLPIYSIWLAVVNLLGVPARLAMDVGWLCGCGYLGYAVTKFTNRAWPGVCVFSYLALQPSVLLNFDRALSENLLAILSAFALAAAIEVWNTRDYPSGRRARLAALVFPIVFGLAFHTRKEGVVLFAPLLIVAWWAWRRREASWRGGLRRSMAAKLLVWPFLAVLLIGTALSAANFVRWGMAVRYELAAAGYERAMKALNRVDAGSGPRHVTVTAAARQLAAAHSPTFQKLMPFFEGEAGKSLANHSAQFTGVPGEIGNGWFYWALRDAGAIAGWHSSAQEADKHYAAIADELEAAFRDGKLKSRSALVPSFVDPDIGKWIRYIPSSTWGELVLLATPPFASSALPIESASAKQFAEFVAVTGRRNVPSVPSIKGWIVVPAGTSITLASPMQASPAWTEVQGEQRPDVPGAFPFSVTSTGPELPVTLRVRRPDGIEGSIPLEDLREGSMAKTRGGLEATLGVDELQDGKQDFRFESAFPALFSVYGWAGYVITTLILAALVKSVWSPQTSAVAALCLLACLLGILARALLLGILDASSWSGLQVRYMLPALPLLGTAGIFSVAILFPERLTRRDGS